MSKPRCLIAQLMHESGLSLLESAGVELCHPRAETMDAVAARIGDCDAVITRNLGLSAQAMVQGARLQVIANHGAGLDRMDLAAASRLGIPVVYTPGANAQAVAEHTILLTLAVARRLVTGHQAVASGDWSARYLPGAIELRGKTMGIVGFGAIGQAVAQIAAHGLGMRIVTLSRTADGEALARLGVEPVHSLEALLAASDVVTLHRPATPGEPPLIDRDALRHTRPGAILINTARAALIDDDALLAALASGQLAGAGLDVFAREPLDTKHPLLHCDKLVLSPHVGASTDETLARMSLRCAEQILDVLAGRRPPQLANPEVWFTRRRAPASAPQHVECAPDWT
jgi:D-3-phosphoglycerate dehydrogenase